MPLGRIQLDRVLLYGAGRALDRGERARRAWLTMPRKSARSLPVPEAVPGPAGVTITDSTSPPTERLRVMLASAVTLGPSGTEITISSARSVRALPSTCGSGSSPNPISLLWEKRQVAFDVPSGDVADRHRENQSACPLGDLRVPSSRAFPVAIVCAWADTNVYPPHPGGQLVQPLRQVPLALARLAQNPLSERFLRRRRRRNVGGLAAHGRISVPRDYSLPGGGR